MDVSNPFRDLQLSVSMNVFRGEFPPPLRHASSLLTQPGPTRRPAQSQPLTSQPALLKMEHNTKWEQMLAVGIAVQR